MRTFLKERLIWMDCFQAFITSISQPTLLEFLLGENTGLFPQFSSVQFISVTQSCLTLCDPMNRSTPGLPVHHQLPEFTQTHVHWVGDAIQLSHPLSSPSPAPNPSQHQGLCFRLEIWAQILNLSFLLKKLSISYFTLMDLVFSSNLFLIGVTEGLTKQCFLETD